MISKIDFHGKKDIGERWEDLAMRELRPFYGELRRVPKGFKYYDLYNDKIKIEVKSDGYSKYSGNICIEYLFRDEPSGISSTRADIWLHFYYLGGRTMTLAPVGELREWIKSSNFPRRANAGDYGNSKVILIPAHKFANRFKTKRWE